MIFPTKFATVLLKRYRKMKKYNFYAGPAILPKEVMEKAARAVVDLDGKGLSILEISHRSKEFMDILDEARQLVKEILSLPENYEVLYLTGGASTQFYMVPFNLLGPDQTAGYVNTGSWASKAMKEAKYFGDVIELASSKDQNFSYIPKGFNVPEHLKYIHITSNNTIFGTQYFKLPKTDVPFVCDMSSDIFSRPFDYGKFGLIYAGAQKNMGPAGTTLVILNKDLIADKVRDIPTMIDYQTHIEKGSSFNTPPVFPIYVSLLTLRWVIEQGGPTVIHRRNAEKANLLYNEIDNNLMFVGTAAKEDRSQMNVVFLLKDETLESAFLKMCDDAGCVGLKGHRSAGGFRASIYNAMEMEGINVLIDVMRSFTAKYGQVTAEAHSN